MTGTTSLAGLGRLGRLAARRRVIIVPLLVAGVLAAGCGTEHAGSGAAGGGPAAGASTRAATATPVPTVTGGAVAAGLPACAGWPGGALHVSMPALFVPVAAERCVTGVQTIPGKGEWETATLEKATGDLTQLATALRRLPLSHTPGTFCPEVAMLAPEIVVISASGQQLIPVLPVSGCGLVQSQVLAAIAALPWQPVSVRLVARVTSSVPNEPATPKAISPTSGRALPDQ